MSTHLSTAPHQSRKKRELTRAVETLKYKNGGGIDLLTLVFYCSAEPLIIGLKPGI